MKKTLLALAVAALSANAFAVNLNDNTGVQNYASEINVPAAGVSLQGVTATVNAGFALATDGYVRFNLANGATFTTGAPLALNGGPTWSVSAGGAGQNYVIFRTDGSGVANDQLLTLTAAVTVTGKNAVGVTYNLYETAANAVAQTGALATRTGTLLNFRSALDVTAENVVNTRIDAVGGESKLFEAGSDTANLTELNVDVAASVLNAAGAPIAQVSDILTGYSWTLNGNFSAADEIADSSSDAFVLTADKQSATLEDAANGVVSYTVTGDDEIAETIVSAVFSATAATGYTIGSITLNNAAVLTKNGATEDVDLALKPGGAYSNFVRISNKDTIAGGFSLRVINDAGESVTFPLSDVEGQPATIAAGASTTQMSIQQIFDAATAKGLVLSGEGKLRLQVTGQVSDLSVQTYTVSKDGNSFATF